MYLKICHLKSWQRSSAVTLAKVSVLLLLYRGSVCFSCGSWQWSCHDPRGIPLGTTVDSIVAHRTHGLKKHHIFLVVFSVWTTPNDSNSMCNLDTFSLHLNSECSPDTSTANALSRSEDQWSSTFLYSLEYLCAIHHFCAHFKGGKPRQALRATSVWRIQSAQDVPTNRF